MSWLDALVFPVVVLTFAVPVAQFAFSLPSREQPVLRRAIALVVVVVFSAIGLKTGLFPNNSQGEPVITEVAVFAFVVALSTSLVLLCKKVSLWTALYCATSGYVAQNLGSTIGWIILSAMGTSATAQPAEAMIASFSFGMLVSLILCELLFTRKIRLRGQAEVENVLAFALLIVVILVNIVASLAIKSLETLDVPLGTQLALSVTHAVTCTAILYLEFEVLVNRRLVTDIATTESLLAAREQQYETSRSSIAAVNARMHVIRHSLAALLASEGEEGVGTREGMRAALQLVRIYDTSYRTGNTALDTALSEKGLVCEREGITLTCVADGNCLEWLSAADVYMLVGSILDDAISCEREIENRDDRSITLVIRQVGSMASIHEEHRGTAVEAEPPSSGIITAFVDSLGGTLVNGVEDDSVFLNILIPLSS